MNDTRQTPRSAAARIGRSGTAGAALPALLGAVAMLCAPGAALAEPPAEAPKEAAKPAIDPAFVSNPGAFIQSKVQPDTLSAAGDPTFATGLFASSRATLLGDLGGIRSTLGRYGITIALSEVSEVFGNPTGGFRQGTSYDGLTNATLQVDTLRAFGLVGGTFNASALQIHGRNLSAKDLGVLQTISGIEANRATRLWELWYDQSFMNGAFDIKVGQQSLDQEFYVSAGSSVFINTMMGWPLIPSVDQYAGGPAYPLSSLGVRLRGEISHGVTGLIGVYDDNPPGGPFNNDSQTRGIEAAGLRFNVKTGALIYGELQYARHQPETGDLVHGEEKGLPGLYKLGFWVDTAKFPDQRFGSDGLSLSDPASNGDPLLHRNNFSVYGLFDQTIYRPDAYEPKAVAIFLRVMGAPEDRNLVSFSANGGITLKAPFEGRDGDTVGLGFGVGKVSNGARGFDLDTAAQMGPMVFSPTRSVETFLELTYLYQAAPWWQIQPDFQYLFRPSGGVLNPLNPTRRIGDAAVFGLHTTITF